MFSVVLGLWPCRPQAVVVFFNFTHNAMSNILSGHTTISGIHKKPYGYGTPKSLICLYSVENYLHVILIYSFTFHKWRWSWILPRIQCPKILSDHTMSSIPENPLVDTQIMNHSILFKLYQFIVRPCTNSGHFISAYLQVSVSILTFLLLPGDWWLFWKMLIMLRQLCKTIIFFFN